MKKALISIASLAFAGVILASCNSNSIKAPKKGKAVDKIDINSTISINKDDKADEVYSLIRNYNYGYISAYYENNSVAYKLSTKTTFKETTKNGYDSDTFYDKMSTNGKENDFAEYYAMLIDSEDEYKGEVYSNDSYKATSKNVKGKNTQEHSFNGKTINAGYTSEKNDKFSLNGGKYTKRNSTTKTKDNVDNIKKSEKTNEYTYLNLEKSTDDSDFHWYYVAQRGETTYDYQIPYYLRTPYHFSDVYDISFNDFYQESFKDYFEISFELTDSEIIFKSKSKYTDLLGGAASDKSRIEDIDYVDALKSLSENEFNGSYIEKEIWISYADFDNKGFTFTYYKSEEVDNYNIEFDWNEDKVKRTYVADDVALQFKDTKYSRVGKYNAKSELLVKNDGKYGKRIDKFLKKAKKNNVYDGLNFIAYDPR